MTEVIQKDDPILQGFESYMKSRRYSEESVRRSCAVMRIRVLPRYSLKEIREMSEYDIAEEVIKNANTKSGRDYRKAIRKFKEYIEVKA